jgi:anti-sigma B factor antagonist
MTGGNNMLNINSSKDGSKLTLALEGRLDTTTAPELEQSIENNLEDTAELVFDLASLEYISSAGLRVLLAAQKKMNKKGSMVIMNANSDIKDIFDVTGFSDIFTIQ